MTESGALPTASPADGGLTLPDDVRLIALDVDGTIIDFNEYLTERMRSAVGAVHRDPRYEVVIATGRSLHATLPVLQRLQIFTGWCVTSNGSLLVRLDPAAEEGYEIVNAVTFDPTAVLLQVHEHLPTALYAVETVGSGYRLTAPFPEGELSGNLEFVDFAHLLGVPATRVIVRSPDHTSEDFVAVTERLGLHEVTYAVGWTAWLDLAPAGVSKASALEIVRKELDIPPAATVAVGDGRNDVEMFDWAGCAVAMGQAPADVVARADLVTDTVEQDGLARVLEALAARPVGSQ